MRYVFGRHRAAVSRGKKKKIVEVDDVFYYIPVLKTIQVQLACSKMLHIVLAEPKKIADPSILEDFCDGTFFQNHELFSNDDRALLLLLYYDDVNFINPLTNKNHKLSFFIINLQICPLCTDQHLSLFIFLLYVKLNMYQIQSMGLTK